MNRSSQTSEGVREDHDQQELPHHAEPHKEHRPQKQVQEGPLHGEDTCSVLMLFTPDVWQTEQTLHAVIHSFCFIKFTKQSFIIFSLCLNPSYSLITCQSD